LISVRGDGGVSFADDGFVVLTVKEAGDFVAVAVGGDLPTASGLLEVFDDEGIVVQAFGIGRGGLVVRVFGVGVRHGDAGVVDVVASRGADEGFPGGEVLRKKEIQIVVAVVEGAGE